MKNTKLITLLLFTYCYFATSLVFASNSIFHYQPAQITLTGIMKVKKFSAPPKNEYIGDTEEIYRYLTLDHPIDVHPQKGDSDTDNEIQNNVKDVQVVRLEDYESMDSWVCERCRQQNTTAKDENCGKCTESNWSNKLIGKHARVTGTLYSRVVRIVMIANRFEEIK